MLRASQLDFFLLRHGCTARIHRPRLYVRPRASAAAESHAVELICPAARAEESRASTVRRRFLPVDPAGRKLLRGTICIDILLADFLYIQYIKYEL